MRVGGLGSGGTEVGIGTDPPEGSGVGVDETSVAGVFEPLRRVATLSVALQHPPDSPEKKIDIATISKH